MIHNGPKMTLSVTGGLRLLQMVSESVTRRCKTLVGVGLYALHKGKLKKTIFASGGLENGYTNEPNLIGLL